MALNMLLCYFILAKINGLQADFGDSKKDTKH